MTKKKDIWNKIGANYSQNWEGIPDMHLSELEQSFIKSSLKRVRPHTLLDIGCGTGRILKCIVNNTDRNALIYGIDYAQSMIDYCNLIFKNLKKSKKIKSILLCDISKENIPMKEPFDFVTAIRVLKYSNNWKYIIKKIYKCLSPGGVFIFTMPNKFSVSFFSNYGINNNLTTVSEIRDLLKRNNFQVVDIKVFSRLPRNLYTIFSDLQSYAKVLHFIEKVLGIFFGKTILGKEIFIVARKSH